MPDIEGPYTVTAPLDLADPLADLGALYAAAQDAHNRGDEFATVCMRLVERLAEVPITHQHQIEHLVAEVERLRADNDALSDLPEADRARLATAERLIGEQEIRIAIRTQERDEARAEVERMIAAVSQAHLSLLQGNPTLAFGWLDGALTPRQVG